MLSHTYFNQCYVPATVLVLARVDHFLEWFCPEWSLNVYAVKQPFDPRWKLAIELILRTVPCLSVDSSQIFGFLFQILYIRLHLRDLCERQTLHRECLLHRKHVAEVSQKTRCQWSNRSETQQNLPRKVCKSQKASQHYISLKQDFAKAL